MTSNKEEAERVYESLKSKLRTMPRGDLEMVALTMLLEASTERGEDFTRLVLEHSQRLIEQGKDSPDGGLQFMKDEIERLHPVGTARDAATITSPTV